MGAHCGKSVEVVAVFMPVWHFTFKRGSPTLPREHARRMLSENGVRAEQQYCFVARFAFVLFFVEKNVCVVCAPVLTDPRVTPPLRVVGPFVNS